ncbi:hypothetical protein ACFWNG_09525 [Streptomyces sp. NPDC058391]|uniref:hypothetical protein n=1 Tax=Streptomyces sp. NPDC058391 TaxID=3346476 RepID=UPI00364DC3F1
MKRPHESTAGSESGDRPRRRRSPLAIATVAAAVLIAGGGGAYVATSASGGSGADGGSGTPGGGGNPPLLALDGPPGGSGPSAPPGIAPGEPDPHGVTYRATSALPDGPDTARVYGTNDEVASAEVARLAQALGVAGTPRSDGTTWKVGSEKDGSGPLLRVTRQAPGTWTFARFGPSPGGDNCLKGKPCPGGGANGAGSDAGSTGFAPGGEGPAVSEAAAKKAAAPVLKALGQGDAELDAGQLLGAVRVVNADPVVGGLPTYGWSTGIQVGADGQVVGGIGQLKAPEQGHAYPVISADEALKELNKQGNGGPPRIGGCATAMPLDGEKPAAPCGPESGAAAKPIEIEKAVFGLALLPVNGRGTLVPSWLFEVAPGGGAMPYTVTQPAVTPEFLKQPAPPRQEAPGGAASAAPGTSAGVTSYSSAGRALTLRFVGGVCSEYAAQADEGGTAVKVKVKESKPEPGTMCVAMAKEQTVTVTLDKPLGGRQVVDGVSGERVPVS